MKTLITFTPQCRVSTQHNEGAHGCRFTTGAISILQPRADRGSRPHGNRCCIEQKKLTYNFYGDSQSSPSHSSVSTTAHPTGLTSEYDETVNMSTGRKGSMRQVQFFKETVNRRNSLVTCEVKQIKFVFFSKQNSNISREIWVSRFGDYGDGHVQEYDAQWFGRNSLLWEINDASSLRVERGKKETPSKGNSNELTSRQFCTDVRVEASLKAVPKPVRVLLTE
jgi:hypothetical protein